MRLTLGTRSFDLTTRALVIGPPPQEPDIVETAAGGAGSRPAAAWVDGSPTAVAAAIQAGVVLLGTCEPGGAIDIMVTACARSGAALVVSATGDRLDDVRAGLISRARQAEAAGIFPDRIVVEPPLTSGLLPHVQRFAELGYPLLVTVTGPHQHALTALAVIHGARLVRTDDVRAATRVCRVVSAILEAT